MRAYKVLYKTKRLTIMIPDALTNNQITISPPLFHNEGLENTDENITNKKTFTQKWDESSREKK